MSFFADNVQPWRPDRPWLNERAGDNAGCAPGYVAQYVGVGSAAALPYPGSDSGTFIRCRAIEGYMPERNDAETGTTAGEYAGIFTGAVRDTARDVANAAPGLALGGLVGLGLAAGIALFISGGFRR